MRPRWWRRPRGSPKSCPPSRSGFPTSGRASWPSGSPLPSLPPTRRCRPRRSNSSRRCRGSSGSPRRTWPASSNWQRTRRPCRRPDRTTQSHGRLRRALGLEAMALQIRFFMAEEDERELLRRLERLELELWPELTDPSARPPIASPSVPLEDEAYYLAAGDVIGHPIKRG